MSSARKLAKVIIPVVIVVAGLVVLGALVKTKKAPKRVERAEAGTLVNVMQASASGYRVKIDATGTVRPTRTVNVIPQVSGTVSGVSQRFETGGFFKANETLFEIDDTDYRLAVEQAEASLAAAEYELAKVESQARVARDEWERLAADREPGAEPNELVVYGPQLKNARASMKSAEAALEQARVNLSRTIVRAPFDCRVSTESIDLGQYVRAGTAVAMLSGTDEAEVEVALPLDKLQWIKVPGNDNGGGSKARVLLGIYGREASWPGRVDRSVGEVDEKDRMMHLVVTVDDPYGLNGKSPKTPLPAGAFVKVTIEGTLLKNVIVLPRSAFRDDSTLWAVDKDNKLRIKKVDVAFMEHERVVISGGIADGETIVTSPLSGASNGLKLRVAAPAPRPSTSAAKAEKDAKAPETAR